MIMSKMLYLMSAGLVLLLLWAVLSGPNRKTEPRAGAAGIDSGQPEAESEAPYKLRPMEFDRRIAATPVCRPPVMDERDDYLVYAAITNQRGVPTDLSLSPGKPKIKAGRIAVEVNSPEFPAVLVLINYYGSLWDIRVTPGTEILAVMVSGYEDQAVSGLDPDVPVVHSSYGHNSRCRLNFKPGDQRAYRDDDFLRMWSLRRRNKNAKYSNDFTAEFRRMWSWNRAFCDFIVEQTGRAPDEVRDLTDARVSFGPHRTPGQELISHGDFEEYDPAARPLTLLNEAVSRGDLRPATARDIRRWREARSLDGRLRLDYPARIDTRDVFVVDNPAFVIPEGLQQPGGHREESRIVTFLIPPGRPVPKGDLAGARLQFLEDGRCLGHGCEYGPAIFLPAWPPPRPKELPPLDLPPACRFRNLNLPETAAIYAGGAYSAKNSGRAGDRKEIPVMEVGLSDPGRTVALILGSHEPSVWNIHVREGTRLAAVALTGHPPQRVKGLPEGVPVLTGSHDEGRCWSAYFGNDGKSLARMNQVSVSLFGRKPDRGFRARDGYLIIDPGLPPAVESSTSPSRRGNGPPQLQDALRRGLIRPAPPETAEAWRLKYIERLGVENLADGHTNLEAARHLDLAYEVLSEEFTIPAGLTGINAADFYVPAEFELPPGELGHATLYWLRDGSCLSPHPDCRFPR